MKFLLVLLGLPACLGLGWFVYQDSQDRKNAGRAQRGEEPVAVRVVGVRKQTVEESVRLVGRLEPRAQVTLRAQVAGYIATLSKDVGDRVQADKPVILLDDSKHQQALATAEAALKVAKANLEVARKEKEPARANLVQYQELFKRGTATRQQVDEAKAALDVLIEKILLQEQSVKAAEVEVKNRRIALQETKIVSKISGFIAERMVEAGDLANPNDPLLRIVDLDVVKLIVSVVEHEYGKVRIGQSARVRVDALPGTVFAGRVTRKAPVLNPDTRTGLVQIEIQNRDRQLKPGMTARASIVIRRRTNAPVVPIAAVLNRGEQQLVFVVVGDPPRTLQKIVTTGIRDNDYVEVLSGIRPTDRIVTLGNRLVESGQLVVPVNSTSTDAGRSKSPTETPPQLEAGGG
jgi:RND family efflux transporter MFP subunit